MKKTSKRIISLLLALVMVAGVCAVGFMASAEDPDCVQIDGDDFYHTNNALESDDKKEEHTYEADTEAGEGHYKCSKCGYIIDGFDGKTKIIKTDSPLKHIELTIGDDGKLTSTEKKHTWSYNSDSEIVYCLDCGYTQNSRFIDFGNEFYHIGYVKPDSRYGIDIEGLFSDYRSETRHIYMLDEATGKYVCIRCSHELNLEGTDHNGFVVKKENEPAGCEKVPLDVYRCRHCSLEYLVQTGIELGHYWPVVLDENDNPVYAKDENNQPILDGDGNPMLLADDRYIDVVWSKDDYESCTITLHCQRPDCNGTLSYTVYTMEDEIGKIERETRTTVCQEVETTYTAIFRMPNIPRGTYDYDLYFETSVAYTTPGTGHVEAEPVRDNEVAATCTEPGSYESVVYCENCDKELSRETVEIPATGHIGGSPVIENEVGATCTETGGYDSVVYCSVCGAEISRTRVDEPALGHTFEYNKNASTHQRYCTVCGYTEEAQPHSWNGSGECSVCHYNHDCDADGHLYGEATAYELGNDKRDTHHYRKCQACGEIIESEHNLKPGWQTDVGYHWVVCDDCGARLQLGAHVDEELNYSDSNGNLVTDGRCDICNKELSHRWKKSGGTPATCTAPGENIYTCANCGEEYRENVTAEGHYWADEEGFVEYEWNADCTQCTLVLKCTHGCGETLRYTVYRTGNTGNIITISNPLVKVDPTCTEDGYTEYNAVFTIQDVSSIMGWHASTDTFTSTGRVLIPALGHTPGDPETENEIPATCTADGSYVKVVHCTVCGEEISRETVTVSATGHIGGSAEIENEVEETCTENGSYDSVVYCTACGEELRRVTVSVPKLGHEFDYEKDVTGHVKYCIRCDYREDKEDHVWDGGECSVCHFNHDCTADGHIYGEAQPYEAGDPKHDTHHYRKCLACGLDDSIIETEHNMKPGWQTDAGYHWLVCSDCGAKVQMGTHIDEELNYSDAEGNTITDGRCDICNMEISHRYKKSGGTPATCTEGGTDKYICVNCGDEYEEATVPEGHYWSDAKEFVEFNWNDDCTKCTLILKCSHGCGETLTYNVYRTGNTGNIIKELPDKTDPTCTKEGYTEYKATFTIQDVTSIRGWHASTDTFETDDPKYSEGGENKNGKITTPALGHLWSEWETTTEPTCTVQGAKERHCTRGSDCDGIHATETQAVPALGHDYATVFTADADGNTHSKKCSRCDATTETAEHTATRFTSNGDGTHTGKCTVCNANFTVECTEFDSVDNGDGTHSETCKECGYHSDAEAHTYEWQASGDKLHKKVCKICGAIDPDNYGPHEADYFFTLDDNQHSAICKICNAEFKENHILKTVPTSVTVEPTCTEAGKGDVEIVCEKCGFIKETKTDVEIPALGHDFDENGVCTRCGATRSCATEGHAVYEGAELQYDGIVHYYTCRYCGASVYPDGEGKLVNVTVTINSDGATEVSPNSARHAAQDYYLDDVNELHSFEHCTKCAHKHNFIKMGTITGNCETYSYDTYKCTTCEQKVNVRKGDQIGHYWPIELENDGLTPKVEDGSVVFDEDYVSFRWGAKNESCTITLTCKRPDCGKTVSYTIYTKKTDFGMITKKKTCLGTKYIATFTNLPDIPTGSDGTYVLTTTASVETGSGSHTPGKVLEKVDPTCTEAGYTKYECKKCGEDFKVTTPATGHDYKMKTDATGKTWYECSKCGASYTLTPCRDGQHVDQDFDFVCEKCHSKISFRENWPHYIIGLPMYWLRKAISWLLDGRKGILKF